MKKMIPRGDDMYGPDVFEVLLQYEVARSKRYPTPLSLLQIEMSASASTESSLHNAVSIFASKINTHIRSVDIPSQSGTFFNLLLPATDESGAHIVCERLLSIFKNKVAGKNNESFAFALQIGASSHPGGSSLSDEFLFDKAQEALLQSKTKGPHTYVLISK